MGLESQSRSRECHRRNEISRGAGFRAVKRVCSRQGGERKSGPLSGGGAGHLSAWMGKAALAAGCKRELKSKP